MKKAPPCLRIYSCGKFKIADMVVKVSGCSSIEIHSQN